MLVPKCTAPFVASDKPLRLICIIWRDSNCLKGFVWAQLLTIHSLPMESFTLSRLSSNGRCDRCNRTCSISSSIAATYNVLIWWCIDCGALLCDDCWPREISHEQGRTNRDGLSHEKIDPRIQQTLQGVLRPNWNEDTLDKLHTEDEETTWFGKPSIFGIST
jgi:hypothetical protein